MDCGEFQKIVYELAQEDARGEKVLGAATAVSARFHAQTCGACAARMREARLLAGALRIAAEDTAENAALPRAEAAGIVNAFREHHRSRERARYRKQRSRWYWAGWMAAAAAAIIFGFAGWRLSRPHTRDAQIANGKGASLQVSPAGRQSAAPLDASGQESDFVPLPYGESLSDRDSAVVVRVSMTRSALASLGYPVAEGREDDLVRADLIVGEDGWPRAVRVVQ